MGGKGSSWAARMSGADIGGFVASLDRQARMDAIRSTRLWVRERLMVGPGATVLDVGCGTGDELGELAGLVSPGGRAIGLDVNPLMVDVARQRLAGVTEASVLVGEAAALPLGNAVVDAVVCERVLQHVRHSPVDAVRECARVVRDGGIVAVTDSDWSSLEVLVADDEQATSTLLEVRARVRLPFTDHQEVGRHLADHLTGEGLTIVDQREAVLDDFAPELVRGVSAGLNAAASEVLSASELTDVQRLLDAALARGALRIAVRFYAVVARR
ncbi:methyltransferase domain-containing protein [Tsukamurella sputi]|uniref:Methyltransferase domain-containing protein n=1 Tax=Tsukamurella sputi TaxID=2591848 RepID=A0A5C5RRF0_9ACTN|nr:methyltransferase domain-containing protein [Tsukamurella sputi]TWS25098.1 methyltransferase domain-containing protein [Tsukamurella sputi]